MAFFYNGAVESEISPICRLIGKIIDMVSVSCNTSDEELMDLRLILSELMINGCEHGNMNNRKKRVSLKLAVEKKGIKIKVSDEGRGFDLDPISAEDKGYMSCSGRGLKIVSELCDRIIIKRNTVDCFLKRQEQDTFQD